MTKPIELYMIGGFLGAGKTTFLRSMMEDMKTKRMGILVNEFGSIGVDGTLIEREGVKMVEINNGSIFCACLKDGFVKALKAFTEQPVDVLIIENSGMADPAGMRTILKNLSPYISRQYEYRGLICLIDCTTFLRYSEALTPLIGQVAEADYIIVNKTDLVSRETISSIHEKIKNYNTHAPIYDTVFAQIPLPLPDIKSGERTDLVRKSSNSPNSRPAVYTLETNIAPNAQQLASFCKAIGDVALRVKGFIKTSDGWLHVDSVGNEVSVEPTTLKLREPLYRGKLVIIGCNGSDIYSQIQSAWESNCATEFELWRS